MDVNTFESQSTSDNLIEDVGAMLQVTRSSMNINADSKGIVIGHVEFTENNDPIDCTKLGSSGKQITPNIDDIANLQSDAEFVLVIEKAAIFNRLAEDQFYDYVPSILVTAKGQPDMATRHFLKRINDELELPILAIMDADIYGFEILRVYSVGSKALSFEASNLAVPNIKWLGLLPSDLKEESGFGIPSSTHIKMTKSDERRIKLLLDEEFVIRKPDWRNQIQTLLDMGIKAEIQALNARDPQYITNHYLPNKLESGDFI
jgi:meiotic recombination protein SPO11